MAEKALRDRKVIDETHTISSARGNGKLRREVWMDSKGRVTRYNLAFINHRLFQKDNGRVVGYDNRHDRHHRHYFGKVEEIEFKSFEDIEARFESDWIQLMNRRK